MRDAECFQNLLHHVLGRIVLFHASLDDGGLRAKFSTDVSR